MFIFSVNYLSVVVAAIIPMILGALWYGPLFGKQWMILQGIDPNNAQKKKEMQQQAKASYILSFLGNIITSFVMAALIATIGIASISQAIILAFLVWLGFAMFLQLQGVLWGEVKPRLWLLNTSYTLLTWICMISLLALWQ